MSPYLLFRHAQDRHFPLPDLPSNPASVGKIHLTQEWHPSFNDAQKFGTGPVRPSKMTENVFSLSFNYGLLFPGRGTSYNCTSYLGLALQFAQFKRDPR
jgi:hypothetical protein